MKRNVPREAAFLDVHAVAQRYSIKPATVWAWARTGTLPQPTRLTPGCSRWQLRALEDWEAERKAASGSSRREYELQRRKRPFEETSSD